MTLDRLGQRETDNVLVLFFPNGRIENLRVRLAMVPRSQNQKFSKQAHTTAVEESLSLLPSFVSASFTMRALITLSLLVRMTMANGANLMSDLGGGEESMHNIRQRRMEQTVIPRDEWLAHYSLQFQGCDEFPDFGDDPNGGSHVHVRTKRVVRFRFCPSNKKGCHSGYGDYAIDMNSFMEHYSSYILSQDKHMAWKDKKHLLADTACTEYKPPGHSHSHADHHHHQYFVGPYCASNGRDVFLGLFSDDSCTVYADPTKGVDTYNTISHGDELPYSKESLIEADTISCANEKTEHQKGEDPNEASLLCRLVHSFAAKCEFRMKGIPKAQQNNGGCSYLDSIEIPGHSSRASSSSSSETPRGMLIAGCGFVSMVVVVVWLEKQGRLPKHAGYGMIQPEDGYIEMSTNEEALSNEEYVVPAVQDDDSR